MFHRESILKEPHLVWSSSLWLLLLLLGLLSLFGLAGGDNACIKRPLLSFQIVDCKYKLKSSSISSYSFL